MITIKCANCKKRLTSFLTKIKGVTYYNNRKVENKDYFEKGFYHLTSENEQEEWIRNSILINRKDNIGMIDHADQSRFVGCCGVSPKGLPNLICSNCKTEIGRETYDCLTPHYIKMDSNKVLIAEDEYGFFEELNDLEQKGNYAKVQEIEYLLQYHQIESAKWLIKNHNG